jgi:hypothetical protein
MMAKKNRGKGPNTQTESVNEVPMTEQNETEQAPQQSEDAGAFVVLNKRNVQKNGIVTYARDGVNASVYFNKSMFNGDAPETVEVRASNLRKPGEGGVGGGRTVDPAKLQERASKAEENARKAQERAQKALDKANKLKARIGGTSAPATPEPPQEREGVVGFTDAPASESAE